MEWLQRWNKVQFGGVVERFNADARSNPGLPVRFFLLFIFPAQGDVQQLGEAAPTVVYSYFIR